MRETDYWPEAYTIHQQTTPATLNTLDSDRLDQTLQHRIVCIESHLRVLHQEIGRKMRSILKPVSELPECKMCKAMALDNLQPGSLCKVGSIECNEVLYNFSPWPLAWNPVIELIRSTFSWRKSLFAHRCHDGYNSPQRCLRQPWKTGICSGNSALKPLLPQRRDMTTFWRWEVFSPFSVLGLQWD